MLGGEGGEKSERGSDGVREVRKNCVSSIFRE